MAEYDDVSELTRYVWEHYGHLLTEFERRVGIAIHARAKEAIGHPHAARFIERRHALAGDAEVERALAEGPESFRRRACRRVLAERSTEVYVNRCPRCDRVVRTPRARQCFWCGHDWHTDPAE